MSSKSRKERRQEKYQQGKTAAAPVRRNLSWQDLMRIFPGVMLRAMVVVLPLTFLMTWLGASKVTLFNNFWVQMGAYAAAYILFNNFIFGPIRKFQASAPKDAKSK